MVVAAEEYVKIVLDGELKDALEAVFERQGTYQREGATRLFRWFVEQDEGLQALILGQIRGSGAVAVARAILERLEAGDAGPGNDAGGGRGRKPKTGVARGGGEFFEG